MRLQYTKVYHKWAHGSPYQKNLDKKPACATELSVEQYKKHGSLDATTLSEGAPLLTMVFSSEIFLSKFHYSPITSNFFASYIEH